MSEDVLDKKIYIIKKKIYDSCTRIDTSLIAYILMIVLACQPLFSIFFNASSSNSLVALYFGKSMLIRLIGIVGLFNAFLDYYAKRFIYKKKYWDKTFLKNPWTGLLAILLIISFLSALFSARKNIAFFGDAYRYEGFFSYLAYAGIFASASLIKDENRRRKLLTLFVSVSFIVALATILKDLAGVTILMPSGGRIMKWSGTFINANHYGYYLCVSMAVSLGLYQEAKSWKGKLIFGTIFLTNTFVLAMNKSYGPFLAILVGFILYSVLYIIRSGFKKAWTLLVLFTLFLLISFLVNKGLWNDVTKTFAEFLNISSSIGEGIGSGDMDEALDGVNGGSGRFGLWKAGIKIMLDYPIFGCGPENVQYLMGKYGGGSMSIPHNELIQIGANMGIPAVLVYVTAIIWFAVLTIKNTKNLSSMTLVGGIGAATYLLSSLVGVSMTVATCYLFLMLGLLNSWFKEKNQEDLNKELLESLNLGDIKKEEETNDSSKEEGSKEAESSTENKI